MGIATVSSVIVLGFFGIGKTTTVRANAVNDYVTTKVKNDQWGAIPVQNKLFGNTPKYAYENGVGKPEGVVVHEDGGTEDVNYSSDTDMDNNEAYMKRNYESAFVHAWVSDKRRDNVADTNYLAWGAGPSANQRFVQFEQVRVANKDAFAHEYYNAAQTAAAWLHQYGLKPKLGTTLWSHAMTSAKWNETDHVDPTTYWAEDASKWFNSTLTMDDFEELVQKIYDNGSHFTEPQYKAKFGNDNAVYVTDAAKSDVTNHSISDRQNSRGIVTGVYRYDKSNSHFYYNVKFDKDGVTSGILEQDLTADKGAAQFKTGDQIYLGSSVPDSSARNKTGKITSANVHPSGNNTWAYGIKLDDGRSFNNIWQADINVYSPVTKSGTTNERYEVSKSPVSGVYKNAPWAQPNRVTSAQTSDYDGWTGHATKWETLANGNTYYYISFDGGNWWVNKNSLVDKGAFPDKLTSENKDAQSGQLKGSASDIRVGDPRWNSPAKLADATAVENSGPDHSLDVDISDIRSYKSTSDGKVNETYLDISQNGQDIGWVAKDDVTPLDGKTITYPTDSTN